jgi:SAM-dependent methyltransferase
MDSPPASVKNLFEAASDWRQALVYGAASGAGILASLPGRVVDVAAQAGTDQHATRVVLEALEAWGIVALDGDGCYQPGMAWPTADVHAALLQQDRFIRGTAAQLPDRVRGIASPPRARSSAELESWQAAMGARARTVAPSIADACLAAVPGARRVLDLGGGHGEYGLEFARRGVEVVLQDQPAMLDFPHRRDAWKKGGVEVFAGDFFETMPAGPFDLVFCAGVTHTFDGDHNRRLYQRIHALVPAGGAFAIVTFLRGTPQARLFAIQMLVVGNHGDTHSDEEYRQWLATAGFDMEVVAADQLDQSVIIARPR